MRKALFVVLLAFVVVALVAAPVRAPSVPPCPTEDAPGPCVWDAHTQGNGQGDSFMVLRDGSVVYLIPPDLSPTPIR